MHIHRLWPAVAFVLLTSACSSPQPTVTVANPSGGDESTTARSLAYVTSTYAGEPASALDAAQNDLDFKGFTAAELRFGTDNGYSNDVMTVAVIEKGSQELLEFPATCEDAASFCEQLSSSMLLWDESVAGEDPGGLQLVMEKESSVAVLFYSGEEITKDPRLQELPFKVARMESLLKDPRIDITTSEAAIEAGEQIDFWYE